MADKQPHAPTNAARTCGRCAHWRRNAAADHGDLGTCLKHDTTKDRQQTCFSWKEK